MLGGDFMKYNVKQAAIYFTKIENWKSIAVAVCILTILVIISPKQLMQNIYLINLINIIISSCTLTFFCKITNYRIHESECKRNFISISFKEFLKILLSCLILCTIFKLFSISCITLIQNANYRIGNMNSVIVICHLLLVFFESLSLLSYCTDLKFSSLFNINKIKFLVFCNFKEYISFIITVILHSIYIIMLIILTSITVIIPLILITYFMFFISDIQAQFIRKVYNLGNL